MKLKDKVQSTTHRVIVFGPPKSGKSKLAAMLSEHFNLLWLDFENGHRILYKLPETWQERIELIEIPDTKVFPIGIQTALKIVTGAKLSICYAHGNVTCMTCMKEQAPSSEVHLNALDNSWIVIWDSVTQIATSAMNHITKNEEELFKPGWPEFMKQGFLMDKFLSQIQQAKYNTVCITHELEVELENGDKRLVPVAGTTNFSRNTAKYFDHVVYSRVANKEHTFSSASTYSNNILTGSRTDVALEDDEVPSLLRIFKPEALPAVTPKTARVPVAGNTTPGNTALSNLAARMAEMKKAAAGGA